MAKACRFGANEAYSLRLIGPSTVYVRATQAFRLTPRLTAGEGEAATAALFSYSVTNLPVWASFNPRTGTLTGHPGPSDTGLYHDIVVTASDGVHTVASPSLSIAVVDLTASEEDGGGVSDTSGAADDTSSNGLFNAAIDVVPAINPRDTTIAVNRADGVTRALVAPSIGRNRSASIICSPSRSGYSTPGSRRA